jgi:hypothetical protein
MGDKALLSAIKNNDMHFVILWTHAHFVKCNIHILQVLNLLTLKADGVKTYHHPNLTCPVTIAYVLPW